MSNFQNKLIVGIILFILLGGGLFTYFKFTNNKSISIPNPISKSNQELVGIFGEYTFTPGNTDGKYKFLQHNFTTGETREISTANSINNPTVLFSSNKVFYRIITEGIKDSGNLGNCIDARRLTSSPYPGDIICPNTLQFFDIKLGGSTKITENVSSFVASQDGKKVAYAKYDGKESKIFIYDTLTKTTNNRGAYSGVEILLVKVNDDEVIFSQDEKLYLLTSQSAKPGIIYDPKLGKDSVVNYGLFENGNSFLVEKVTSLSHAPGVYETGIFDLKNNTYSFLQKGEVDDSRLTILSSPTKEEISLYKSLTGGNVYHNSALALHFTLDHKHLLLRKGEFIGNQGQVTFFIKPSDDTQNLIVKTEKANGNEPNIYFLGWVK